MPSRDPLYTSKQIQAQITSVNTEYVFPVVTPEGSVMDIFRVTYANPTATPATISVSGQPSGTPVDLKVVPADNSIDTKNQDEPIATLPGGDSPAFESNVSGVYITIQYIVREGTI